MNDVPDTQEWAAARIDEICDKFEAAFQDEAHPRIEDSLARIDEQLRPRLLEELLKIELEYRRNRGDQTEIREYVDRFPEYGEVVEAGFSQLDCLPPKGYGKWIAWNDSHPAKLVKKGGMGEVRIAEHDHNFQRRVAVKTIRRERLEPQARENSLARFNREAEILGSLNHPGVPPVYDRGTLSQPAGMPYFAMRLVEGRTFAELLAESHSTADVPRHVDVIRNIAEAMGHAHQQGIIHRDLKPPNVMVGEFGEIQIMDWGSAKRLGEAELAFAAQDESGEIYPLASTVPVPKPQDLSEDKSVALSADNTHGSVPGTPAYMSPEHARRHFATMTPASDVFSMGSMLCEVLTGKPAFLGNTVQAWLLAERGDLADTFDRLDRQKRTGRVDPELVETCVRCLAVEPKDRFADCGELAKELATYQESVQERLRQKELNEAKERTRRAERRRQRKWSVGAAAAVLLLVTGGVAFWADYSVRQADRLAGELQQETQLGETLSKLEAEQKSLLEDQRSRRGWERLRMYPAAWDARLASAKAMLKNAQDIRDTSGYRIDDGIRGRIERTDKLFGELVSDRELSARVEEMGISAIVRTASDENDATEVWRSIGKRRERNYRELFKAYPAFDPDVQDVASVVQAVSASRIPWLWVDAYDDYALAFHHEQQWPFRQKLRDIGLQIDEDVLASRIRRLDRSMFREPDEIQTIVHDIQALDQPVALIAALISGLKHHKLDSEALQLLERAAYRRSQDFGLWLGLGSETRGTEMERWAFATALALRPENPVVNNELGVVFLEQGMRAYQQEDLDSAGVFYARSERHFAKSLESAPTPLSSVVHHNLGYLKEQQVEWLRTKETPRLWRKHFQMKDSKRAKELVRQVTESYETAVAIDPRNVAAWNNLGTLQRQEGRLNEAESSFRKALEADPKRFNALVNLANLLYNEKRLTEAEPLYEKAADLEPGRPEPWVGLGEVHHGREEFQNAIESYSKALERYGPDHRFAQYCRKQIADCKRQLSEEEADD